MFLSRATLAMRLVAAFGLVCLVMALAAGVGIWRLAELRGLADDLGGPSAERALLARELQGIVVISAHRAETLLELGDNPAFVARIDADRKATSIRSEAVRKRLEELATDDESKRLFAAVDRAGNAFRQVRDGLVRRRKAGETLPADTVALRLRPAADAYAKSLEDFAGFQREQVVQARAEAARNAGTGIWLLAVGSLLGLAVGAVSAWLLSRSILGPLQRASQLASRISQGDLTAGPPPARPGSRDEVRAMLGELGLMQARLVGLVGRMHDAADHVAMASAEIGRASCRERVSLSV